MASLAPVGEPVLEVRCAQVEDAPATDIGFENPQTWLVIADDWAAMSGVSFRVDQEIR